MPLLSVHFCVVGVVDVVAVVGACAAEVPGTSACAATIAAAAASRISRLIPNPLVAKSQLHWANPRSPLRPEPSSVRRRHPRLIDLIHLPAGLSRDRLAAPGGVLGS